MKSAKRSWERKNTLMQICSRHWLCYSRPYSSFSKHSRGPNGTKNGRVFEEIKIAMKKGASSNVMKRFLKRGTVAEELDRFKSRIDNAMKKFHVRDIQF